LIQPVAAELVDLHANSVVLPERFDLTSRQSAVGDAHGVSEALLNVSGRMGKLTG
jgi:hypothetical protein